MLTNTSYSSLSLSAYLVFQFTLLIPHLWRLSWRVIWLVVACTIAALCIASDQLYLIGWKHKNIDYLIKASHIFTIQRDIRLGPSYYFLTQDKASEEALRYINIGIDYDPNAADLLQAQVKYSLLLGKNSDAIRSFGRLALIAPNDPLVKKILSADNIK